MRKLSSVVRHVLVAGLVSLPGVTLAQAPTSTGVNVVGGRDQSWQVMYTPLNGFPGVSSGWMQAFLVLSPPDPWQDNAAGQYAWIGASPSATLSPATGAGQSNYEYRFRTVFDVSDPASVAISFLCAKDNTVGTYSVNGTAYASSDCGTDFQFGSQQVLSAGLTTGSNTLEFVVRGDGTTDGLLVNITSTPEPASLMLMATGLVGIAGVAGLRRQRRIG